ncbi:MAG: PQQ-dependent catabolism-associated CXXCW motif protein [Kiloniellales bacterium]|nr:PQQ-dependent catabolism-associated CXXCW motif protein [Kiloniellales bacterium]
MSPLRVSASLFLGLLVGLSSNAAQAQSDDRVPEPDGYRMDSFRAPVPATLKGATVVSTKEVEALVGAAVLIDVLPRPPRPEGLKEGTIWRPRPRSNIPGSAWLPNTGFGVLPISVEAYFRDNLTRLTEGDPARKLLFYCQADCWMSWNAAKRALTYGYSQVYWYPDGTDGWGAAGLPLEPSEPEPGAF